MNTTTVTQHLPPTLAELLVRHRKEAGMTQAMAAAEARFDSTTLSKMENGRRAPTLSQLERLCRVYGLDDEQRTKVMRTWAKDGAA